MNAEAQRQFDQLVVDVRNAVSSNTHGAATHEPHPLATIYYRDRAPGLFADRPTTGRELVLAMLTERARRDTLTVLHVSDDQATFEVRLRCGLVVCITPSKMPLAIGETGRDTE
jgi:hypothetical protein